MASFQLGQEVKRHDWHARLIALIEKRTAAPFAWGSNDCCLWPADAVLAMTGRDPAAAYRGRYATQRGAAVLLKRLGGLTSVGALCGSEIPPLCAQVGDVGLVSSNGERDAGAVCIGDLWVAVVKNGLGYVEFMCVRKAWRVE